MYIAYILLQFIVIRQQRKNWILDCVCVHRHRDTGEEARERGHRAGTDLEDKAQGKGGFWCIENSGFYGEWNLCLDQELVQTKNTWF